jgi:hypothetical protein
MFLILKRKNKLAQFTETSLGNQRIKVCVQVAITPERCLGKSVQVGFHRITLTFG